MINAPRHIWLTTLAVTGPRVIAAVALTAAFAFVAPSEGSLDTGHQQPDSPASGDLQDPLGISGAMGGVKDLTTTDAVKLAANAEELSIPPVALAAYQRSATVLNAADATCRIDWALVAAIGMIESNHGRFGGSELGSSGAASPAIIGPQLNGAGGVAEIRDTDNGLYDHDTDFDRAVGPMQFIPSTWTYAGADGDGDNRRDPQDIDDASVAGAAYLCAGTEDVSTDPGARSAIFRYNQSETYVDTVLQIADQYRNGEFPGSAIVDGGSPSTMKPTVSALPPKAVRAEKPAGPKASGQPKAAPAPTTPDAKTKASEAPEPSKSAGPKDNKGDSDTDDGNSDGETTPPPDLTTRATLTAPCTVAMTAVYTDDFMPDVNKPEVNELYADVFENCITKFVGQSPMPTEGDIVSHVRGLATSDDSPIAGLDCFLRADEPTSGPTDGATDSTAGASSTTTTEGESQAPECPTPTEQPTS